MRLHPQPGHTSPLPPPVCTTKCKLPSSSSWPSSGAHPASVLGLLDHSSWVNSSHHSLVQTHQWSLIVPLKKISNVISSYHALGTLAFLLFLRLVKLLSQSFTSCPLWTCPPSLPSGLFSDVTSGRMSMVTPPIIAPTSKSPFDLQPCSIFYNTFNSWHVPWEQGL